jgi:hypothetical protein
VNFSIIPEMTTMWLAVNVGAMVILIVLSYFSSIFILDGLASLDKWMFAKQHRHKFNDRAKALHGPKHPPP